MSLKILNDIEALLPRLTIKCPICNSLAEVENHGMYSGYDRHGDRFHSVAVYLSCHSCIKYRIGGAFLLSVDDNHHANIAILRILSSWNTAR